MNHKERISAVLTGQPVDRVPVSIWGHDFLREWSAQELAAHTIERQRAYGYDFVKINPRWTLFAEPWGNTYEPPVEQRFPRLVEKIIQSVEDVANVPEISVHNPILGEHVQAVRLITDEIGDEVDSLATLFSPLAVLGLLCGGVGRPLTQFMRDEHALVHEALTHITRTLTQHAQELLTAGACGIFYAPLQWTSLPVCSQDLYAQFGTRYDLELLDQIATARFNMLQICGSDIAIERFCDYPVPVLNWDNFDPQNPSLKEGSEISGKVVAGGIPHKRIHKLSIDDLQTAALNALDGLDSGVMLAGGCGIGATVSAQARHSVVTVANAL